MHRAALFISLTTCARRRRLRSAPCRPSQRQLDARKLPNGNIVPEYLVRNDPAKTQGQDLTVG